MDGRGDWLGEVWEGFQKSTWGSRAVVSSIFLGVDLVVTESVCGGVSTGRYVTPGLTCMSVCVEVRLHALRVMYHNIFRLRALCMVGI